VDTIEEAYNKDPLLSLLSVKKYFLIEGKMRILIVSFLDSSIASRQKAWEGRYKVNKPKAIVNNF
jgi:hypothetical protein